MLSNSITLRRKETATSGDYTEIKFAISAYQKAASSTTSPADASSWTDSQPTATSAKPYLWMRSVKYTWNTSKRAYDTGQAYYSCLTGPQGASSTTYTADLNNEMTGVPCDGSNKVTTAVTAHTEATLYYGATPLASTVSYSPSEAELQGRHGITITDSTPSGPTHNLSFAFTKGAEISSLLEVTIRLTCSSSGTHAGKSNAATFSILPSQPGANGASPVIYDIVPSTDEVVFSKKADGTIDTTSKSVTFQVRKTIGNASSVGAIPTGFSLRYDFTSSPATSTSGLDASSGVTVSSTRTKLYLSLFNASGVLIDKESIPVLKDGTNGKNLTSVNNFYKWTDSGSGTKNTDNGWSKNSIPTHTYGTDYLWNYEECLDNNGSSLSKSDATCIGFYPNGVVKIYEFYLVNNGSTPGVSDINITTDEPLEAYGSWKQAPDATSNTNRYLWNVEVTKMQSGDFIVGTPHTAGVQGPQGASASSYVADLNNEMSGVPCDTSNRPSAESTLITTAKLMHGTTTLTTKVVSVSAANGESLSNYGITYADAAGTINSATATSHKLTFTVAKWISGKTAIPSPLEIVIKLQCTSGTHNGATGECTFSILPSVPGAAGASPVIWDIIPSESEIVFPKSSTDGTSLDTEDKILTVTIRKTVGSTITDYAISSLPTGMRFDYSFRQFITTSGGGRTYTTSGITVQSTHTRVYMSLFSSNGTLLDKESVPVLKDGTDGPAGDGITSVTESYKLSTSSTMNAALWTLATSATSASATSKALPYLWKRIVTTWRVKESTTVYELIDKYIFAGMSSIKGALVRDCGDWTAGVTYYRDDTYIDVFCYYDDQTAKTGKHYYMLAPNKTSLTASASTTPKTDCGSKRIGTCYERAVEEFDGLVHHEVLLAENCFIKCLGSGEIFIGETSKATEELTGWLINKGAITYLKNGRGDKGVTLTKDGELKAPSNLSFKVGTKTLSKSISEDVTKELLDTGIDIEHKQIILTANKLICQNNSGSRTAWLDEYGNFITVGIQSQLIQQVTDFASFSRIFIPSPHVVPLTFDPDKAYISHYNGEGNVKSAYDGSFQIGTNVCVACNILVGGFNGDKTCNSSYSFDDSKGFSNATAGIMFSLDMACASGIIELNQKITYDTNGYSIGDKNIPIIALPFLRRSHNNRQFARTPTRMNARDLHMITLAEIKQLIGRKMVIVNNAYDAVIIRHFGTSFNADDSVIIYKGTSVSFEFKATRSASTVSYTVGSESYKVNVYDLCYSWVPTDGVNSQCESVESIAGFDTKFGTNVGIDAGTDVSRPDTGGDW